MCPWGVDCEPPKLLYICVQSSNKSLAKANSVLSILHSPSSSVNWYLERGFLRKEYLFVCGFKIKKEVTSGLDM